MDPVAAQNHASKHPEIHQPLVWVVPQPRGTVLVQPNTVVHMDPNTTVAAPRIPQVAAPPKPQSRRGGRSGTVGREMFCQWCPRLPKFKAKSELNKHRKRWHPWIYQCTMCPVTMYSKRMRKHLRKAHKIPRARGALRKLPRKRVGTDNRAQTTLDRPSADSSSDDESQSPSEDEEDLSSDNEGHMLPEDGVQSSHENKQEFRPEHNAKQPVRDNRKYLGCDLCPETFLSEETLVMHAKFVHCWRCGYCRNLPPFTSMSLWREHRSVVHGLVGWAEE